MIDAKLQEKSEVREPLGIKNVVFKPLGKRRKPQHKSEVREPLGVGKRKERGLKTARVHGRESMRKQKAIVV